MLGRVISYVAIIVAILMGVMAIAMPLDRLHDYMVVVRFFENMIPALAVGALVKYLCGSCWNND